MLTVVEEGIVSRNGTLGEKVFTHREGATRDLKRFIDDFCH